MTTPHETRPETVDESSSDEAREAFRAAVDKIRERDAELLRRLAR